MVEGKRQRLTVWSVWRRHGDDLSPGRYQALRISGFWRPHTSRLRIIGSLDGFIATITDKRLVEGIVYHSGSGVARTEVLGMWLRWRKIRKREIEPGNHKTSAQ